jgi:hypothetical protein
MDRVGEVGMEVVLIPNAVLFVVVAVGVVDIVLLA